MAKGALDLAFRLGIYVCLPDQPLKRFASCQWLRRSANSHGPPKIPLFLRGFGFKLIARQHIKGLEKKPGGVPGLSAPRPIAAGYAISSASPNCRPSASNSSRTRPASAFGASPAHPSVDMPAPPRCLPCAPALLPQSPAELVSSPHQSRKLERKPCTVRLVDFILRSNITMAILERGLPAYRPERRNLTRATESS